MVRLPTATGVLQEDVRVLALGPGGSPREPAGGGRRSTRSRRPASARPTAAGCVEAGPELELVGEAARVEEARRVRLHLLLRALDQGLPETVVPVAAPCRGRRTTHRPGGMSWNPPLTTEYMPVTKKLDPRIWVSSDFQAVGSGPYFDWLQRGLRRPRGERRRGRS